MGEGEAIRMPRADVGHARTSERTGREYCRSHRKIWHESRKIDASSANNVRGINRLRDFMFGMPLALNIGATSARIITPGDPAVPNYSDPYSIGTK